MSRLLALSLRRDPRVQKLPPYLSFLCVLVGLVWLLLLPLDDYARKTYISENALLPGQVHTYFSGSESHVLRAYRSELEVLASEEDQTRVNDKIEEILKGLGVKVGRQSYTYNAAGRAHNGENVYGILQAPRGDATEAIVLVAAIRGLNGQVNRNGVALALTLARYFKRWSLWSKDIIIVFPPDSETGTQAWVDAYHDAHDPRNVAPLPLKSGALQGALALDYPGVDRFSALQIIYDGVNGQLPNLDLVNSVGNIASGQMGITGFIQGMRHHKGTYKHRLTTIFRGMVKQSLGNSWGPHSSFMPYHVDAVTLQPYGKGFHDEMAMGRVIEGSFRSLNNLLEHLHQSFFFYLLMQRDRFVSIGTYLPSAMLLAANFSIMAIYLWVQSGQVDADAKKNAKKQTKAPATEVAAVTVERSLVLPVAIVAICHALSAVPLYVLNNTTAPLLPTAFAALAAISTAAPFVLSYAVLPVYKPTQQQILLMKSLSLLVLGMALSTLATLNFSLAFVIGVLTAPMSFVGLSKNESLRWASATLLTLLAPATVIYSAVAGAGLDMGHLLEQASFGWTVWGMYTPIVVWTIWWPAWTISMVSVLC
ncbi:GPI transamidase component-like protein [Emericellopsis cladophorae]|uniref:GPI transamidase component-like protein n=1 Tax=Emericellopsis cladophorae TaxID=2686198 RepID=A0A9Q0BB52_9HYPO|nr:GPI transamidase component-like protein [Emericellopsis cladophorae]KAI6779462.1 GPI transamidase component-like protein [Emericellopsis cladophorae]